jgi:hypothetical protein
MSGQQEALCNAGTPPPPPALSHRLLRKLRKLNVSVILKDSVPLPPVRPLPPPPLADA